jgi:hypothetical protein
MKRLVLSMMAIVFVGIVGMTMADENVDPALAATPAVSTPTKAMKAEKKKKVKKAKKEKVAATPLAMATPAAK